jgi:hypothetical protein
MKALHARNGLIYMIAADGDPPERYIVGFRCRGVAQLTPQNDRPLIRDDHRVELILTIDYPRIRPLMRWLTPIFHPNFNEQGDVCIKEWYPQQQLHELCEVLAEMIQYKNYNTTSPLNMEAALWAMRHRDELPIDDRNPLAQVAGSTTPAPVAHSVYQTSVVVTGTIPIMLPGTAQAEELAGFCQNCGFAFQDADLRICPRCGVARTRLS